MNAYYNITKRIYDYFQANEIINTTTLGDITEVDLNRQTIFPLAHLIVNNATITDTKLIFNISIILADLVDISKDSIKEQLEPFKGNNNLQDVHNTTLAIANEFVQHIRRGNLFDEYYISEDDVTAEPFTDRFENLLAGWTISFNIEIPNNNVGVC